jgi:hypothetical protein
METVQTRSLEALRTRLRVSEPEFARHELIQTAIGLLQVPVCYFGKTKVQFSVGTAPSDAFYRGKTLYVGPKSQVLKNKNSIWHELSHALVAAPQGKLELDNWGMEDWKSDHYDDEILTCRLELWMGFISGFYSLNDIQQYLEEYSFTTELDYDDTKWGCNEFTQASVLSWLEDARTQAIENPLVRKLAGKFGGYSKKNLATKFKAATKTAAELVPQQQQDVA